MTSKAKVKNKLPMIGPSSVGHWPTSDMYFKGTLFINTLRHVVNDDKKWWAGVKSYTTQFKKQNFYTVDVLNFFNNYFDYDFEKIFDQYLYFNNLPILQIAKQNNGFKYRWQSDVALFDMPIGVMIKQEKMQLQPTTEWQALADVHDINDVVFACSSQGWTHGNPIWFLFSDVCKPPVLTFKTNQRKRTS